MPQARLALAPKKKAGVRVPGGSPFSQQQLHEKNNSTFVKKNNKNIHNHWPEQ